MTVCCAYNAASRGALPELNHVDWMRLMHILSLQYAHSLASITCITPGRRRLSAPSTAPSSTSSSGRLKTSRSTSRAPPVLTVTFMPPFSGNPTVCQLPRCHVPKTAVLHSNTSRGCMMQSLPECTML